MFNDPLPKAGEPIGVGDICLDLSQGRPVHVLEVHEQNVAEWSGANDYDLAGNYANNRFDTDGEDCVFECVYCSSIKSEPSKTYAFPESRLARVETEAADDGRRVRDRVRLQVLEELFDAAVRSGSDRTMSIHEGLARDAAGKDMTNEARELARAAHFGGGGDGDDSREGPTRSEPADFGGGESTGVQDL